MPVHPRQVTPSLLQVDAILSHLTGRQALAEVCRFLTHEFSHYRWAGVYRLDGTTLVLDGWDGPQATEHTRIPLDKGICGQAARENRTVIVADVRADPSYLACFLETRAEIVVPIRDGSTVLGEIDIDGNDVNAYDDSDRRFLESVAAKLASAVRTSASEPPPPA
jgi:L-methionine (R)-S-oxide reductase